MCHFQCFFYPNKFWRILLSLPVQMTLFSVRKAVQVCQLVKVSKSSSFLNNSISSIYLSLCSLQISLALTRSLSLSCSLQLLVPILLVYARSSAIAPSLSDLILSLALSSSIQLSLCISLLLSLSDIILIYLQSFALYLITILGRGNQILKTPTDRPLHENLDFRLFF